MAGTAASGAPLPSPAVPKSSVAAIEQSLISGDPPSATSSVHSGSRKSQPHATPKKKVSGGNKGGGATATQTPPHSGSPAPQPSTSTASAGDGVEERDYRVAVFGGSSDQFDHRIKGMAFGFAVFGANLTSDSKLDPIFN